MYQLRLGKAHQGPGTPPNLGRPLSPLIIRLPSRDVSLLCCLVSVFSVEIQQKRDLVRSVHGRSRAYNVRPTLIRGYSFACIIKILHKTKQKLEIEIEITTHVYVYQFWQTKTSGLTRYRRGLCVWVIEILISFYHSSKFPDWMKIRVREIVKLVYMYHN